MKDLVVMVADKNAQFALKGALNRPQSLGIRPIEFDFRVHSGRDGGVRSTGPEMLALETRRFHYGLLVLDFEGCGTDQVNALELERELDRRLDEKWQNRAKAIVIDPEVDVWMWGADNALENLIAWPRPEGNGIRNWLRSRGFQIDANEKPTRPKEALEQALQVPGFPRSSALYQEIASTISLRRCTDPAFQRLRAQLTSWFSAMAPR